MDYQLHSVYHPYSEVHHRNPIAPKPFPHGVSLGTAGISNTPRSVASRLLEMSDFPSKYERRAELDRMKSKRRLENNDFGLLPYNSLSTGLNRTTHYDPYSYTVPGNDYVTTRIAPVSRYPVRPIRMVALAPLSSRCIPMPDSSLDEFTYDVEADDARFYAGKEARRIQSALWQSAATDRVVRQCKERNRIRTQQKRIANARTLAPIFSSTANSNLGPRQKVLISYHTGGGTSAAPERETAKEPRKPKWAPAINGTDEDDSVDFKKWVEKRKKARDSIYELESAANETEPVVKEDKQVEPETVTEVKSIPEPEPEPEPGFQPESIELQPESTENLPIETEETQSTFSTNEQPADKHAGEPTEEVTISLAPKSIKKSKYSKEETSLKDKKDRKDRLFKKEKATPVAKEEPEPAPKSETVTQPQPIPETHTEPEPIPEPVKQVEEEIREVESEVQAVESNQEAQEEAEVVDAVSQNEEKPVETDTSRTTETFEETDVAEEVPESKSDEPEFKISDEPHEEISEEVHVEEKSNAKGFEVVEEHSAEEHSSGVVELDESEKPKVEVEAAEEEKLVIEEIEEKEVSEAKPTLRKLKSVISYQEGDACDPVEWEEEESSTQHEEVVEERVSRKIVLSASEEAIYQRYAAAESKEDKVPEEEDDGPGTTETAEDPSTTEEQTVKDVAHDLVEADPVTEGNDDLGDISASTNEHAEAGSAATGEETLSANGRPMSIDAESLVADDEQILDEALEATYCLHGQQLSEPHVEQPDEETEKYEDNEQTDSLIIEEDE